MTCYRNIALLALIGLSYPGLTGHALAAEQIAGDVLLIDSIDSVPAIQSPHTGMNMATVRQQYGDPAFEERPVGDPPITRWDYDGFSVYFEHDLVLHSVIQRPNQN